VTDEPRRVYLGLLPSGADVFVADGEADPLTVMLSEANARLDAERAEAERVRLAALADIERARNTRRAKAARRFKRALQMFRRS
jgi:hypothetical protein